jgi:hypothetical protein
VAVGNLEIGLVSDTYVTLGWAELFQWADDEIALAGAGWAGYPQLGPFLYAAVRTNDDVREARLVRDGTTVDATAPTGGWAVLAAQLPPGGPSPEGVDASGEVVLVGDDGAELDRRSTTVPDNPYDRPECQPPPPGLPPEVRPAAAPDADAVAAITSAFDGAFGRSEAEERDVRPFVQDGDRLDDAWAEDLRARTADYGITEVRAVVHEVGFLDDTTAIVVFDLVGTPLGWMLGEAVLVDGTWRVSSQTWCALVEQTGVTCPEGMRDPMLGTTHFPAEAG